MAKDTTQYKIFSELKDFETYYNSAPLEKIDGLTRKQKDVIKMCEYYSDSRYLGESNKGNKRDGKPIPFYNIVNYRVMLAKTATDLDIKDIQILSDREKYQVHAMLLNREAYEWMKKTEFGITLNTMGHYRPKYGGYLVKKVEQDGELKLDVVRWTNVMTDQNDILGGPIVEMHYLSPVELKKKDDAWDNVEEVLRAYKKIKAKDRPAVITVYEILGEFPIAVYKNSQGEDSTEKDEFTYSLQHYFVADLDGHNFLMFAEEKKGEVSDYYEYLPWEENGYGLGRGVIEDCEEAQVWTNDSVINESFAMALAGRAGIITNSKTLGNSVLEHDHGKIYELKKDELAQPFNLAPAALGQYQVQIEKWRMQGDNVATSYNSITGEQPPSGTPYSQTALLNQVASKPFDQRREEWGLHLTKLFEKWVIPYLVKKLKREHVLVSEFSDTELDIIDESFAAYHSNKEIIAELLKGNMVSPMQQQGMMEGYKQHIKKNGKKRYIEIPDNYFDDIECKVSVITTGEQKNKAATLQSLSTILGDLAKFYQLGVITDPKLIEQIFKEIIENSGAGISPVSIGKFTRSVPQGMPSGSPTMPPSAGVTPATNVQTA